MRNCYSPLKVFHHRDRLDALRRGQLPSPIHVQIIPTNRCNQDCEFCAYRISGYSSNEQFDYHDQIQFFKLKEIVESCREMGVKAIELTGGGEPTLHPDFNLLCELIREADIDYGIVTNGTRMSNGVDDALLGAKWVRVSLDSASAETYAKTRRSKEAVFHRVHENIRRLVAQRGDEPDPVIGVGFVVTEHNYVEISAAAAQARTDGADNLRISAFFQDRGESYFAPFLAKAEHYCREAREKQTDRFTVFDLFSDRLGDLHQGPPDYADCNVQKLCTYIGADLNVYRCCVLAYNNRGLLGSLGDQTLQQLWTSPDNERAMRDFDARQCPRCMFNGKNRTIRYALDPAPEHVNFL